jgi:hypothetical protein
MPQPTLTIAGGTFLFCGWRQDLVRGGTLLFRNSQTGGKIIPCVKNRVYIVVSLAPYLQLSAHSIHEFLDEV